MQTVSSVVKMMKNIWWRAIFLYRPSAHSAGIRHNVVNGTTGHFQSGKWLYKCVVCFRTSGLKFQRGQLMLTSSCLMVAYILKYSPAVVLDSLEDSWHVCAVHCWPCKLQNNYILLYGRNVSKNSYLCSIVVFCWDFLVD